MKPHLVLLPGWSSDQALFESFTQPLSDHFTFSSLQWTNLSHPSDIDKRVAAHLATLPHSHITLCGWSLGSLAALKAASQCPSIDRIVLFSGTSRFTSDRATNYLCGVHERIIRMMQKKLAHDPDAVLSDFFKQMFSSSEQAFIPMIEPWFKTYQDSVHSLAAGLDYLLHTDLRQTLSSIQARTLLIHGTDDRICPIDACSYLQRHLSSPVSMMQIEQAGHMPFLTNKVACQEAIIHFIPH